jgi:tripartite-type tricarboxylate transporter receptor subunit TctC
MKLSRRRAIIGGDPMSKMVCAAVLAVTLAMVAGATAQPYPSRPITVIVPFAAGGSTDIVARTVSERMKVSLGQPVIAENVTGAGGTIGVTRLLKSPPDGYTLAIGQWTSHVGAGAMYPLTFDLLNDFEPISMLSIGAIWIVGRSNLPAQDLKALIAWLKASPGKASAATIGPGSGAHMCLVHFQNMTGTSFQLVPYRGAAPAMQDLMAGQLDLSCLEAGQTLPLYRNGNLKAFAVLASGRWFAAPEVPTIDEAGVPGLHFPWWHGLWAPKGTPRDVIAALNAAIVEALADPGVRQRLTDLGHEIVPRAQQTPAALAAYHKAEVEKWWPIIKAANIKLQ